MPLSFGSESLAASNPTNQSVTTFTEPLHEGETATYSVQLTDSAGDPIADTDFSAITMTLVDEATFAVINSRDSQDVLNLNNVTLSATALLTWLIQPEDTVFVDPTQTRKIEYHRAIITFTFDIGAGTEVGISEIRFPVRKSFVAGNQSLS